jgi:hypothetical protein
MNLETVASVCFAINHIQHFLADLSSQLVAHGPVVSRPGTLFVDVEVLGIVNVLVGTRSDRVDDSWLEIKEDGAWDVASVVGLVEEDIFAVTSFAREILEVSVLVDAVFLAKLLPELRTDWIPVRLATTVVDLTNATQVRNPP